MCCSLKINDAKIAKISPSGHHRTNLSEYIFATKSSIDYRRKKLVKQQYLSHMSFGPLVAEIGSLVWGALANFNGFRLLAALLHGSLVVGVSQTLRVEQRATSILGMAAITLGIGQHSSFQKNQSCCFQKEKLRRLATAPEQSGPKSEGCCAPFRGGAGSSSNRMPPGARSTCVPSGILIHPTV